jgi:hypothetical protein
MSTDKAPSTGHAPTGDSKLIHSLKNHLCIILGFSEFLLDDCADDHPHRADLQEIHNAALAAMAIVPEVDRRLR